MSVPGEQLPTDSLAQIGSSRQQNSQRPWLSRRRRKERHPFRESEVFADKIAVWLQDSQHLVEGTLPIGDVVRHHVGGYEVEFVVAEWQLASIGSEKSNLRG